MSLMGLLNLEMFKKTPAGSFCFCFTKSLGSAAESTYSILIIANFSLLLSVCAPGVCFSIRGSFIPFFFFPFAGEKRSSLAGRFSICFLRVLNKTGTGKKQLIPLVRTFEFVFSFFEMQ